MVWNESTQLPGNGSIPTDEFNAEKALNVPA
jgi:hypothetical protein